MAVIIQSSLFCKIVQVHRTRFVEQFKQCLKRKSTGQSFGVFPHSSNTQLPKDLEIHRYLIPSNTRWPLLPVVTIRRSHLSDSYNQCQNNSFFNYLGLGREQLFVVRRSEVHLLLTLPLMSELKRVRCTARAKSRKKRLGLVKVLGG